MAVRRIVPNVAATQIEPVARFYREVLALGVVMDLGWIVTLAGAGPCVPQISVIEEGSSGAPVPDLSVEVDDLDAVLRRAEAGGLPIAYGPVDGPWGVRRFFLRDPAGRLLNILEHRVDLGPHDALPGRSAPTTRGDEAE